MDLQIGGKVAFVAASTSGLGRASALALAAEGARVCITGRNEQAREEVVSQIREAAGVALSVPLDIEDAACVEQAIDMCESELGPVDILVLNGPGPKPASPTTITSEDVAGAVARLIEPHVRMVNRVLPGMRERGWGRIIAIGSTAVVTPSQQLVLSTIGRQGLAGYLKALSQEVGGDGVTVNMVHPGRILTPRIDQLDEDAAAREGVQAVDIRQRFEQNIPAKRLGDPAELGATVAFLASQQAAYITGTAVRLDGGVTPVL
ncbi:SDR family oxidoreductase [uncultured Actinomyces sp.]|uniref:SDR family oxidoreductase n=1 Tax=uncultured Actinomyces sp. TaxID=249061 RepID=UPI00261739EE|nr:SDR family oxidoreductase [uncultured Actinomyces sp.]